MGRKSAFYAPGDAHVAPQWSQDPFTKDWVPLAGDPTNKFGGFNPIHRDPVSGTYKMPSSGDAGPFHPNIPIRPHG